MWEIVSAAALSSAAAIQWSQEYDRATPERKLAMIRERKIASDERERKATEERRHRELMDAVRSEARHSANITHHTAASSTNSFMGGFLGGLFGGMFK